MIVTPHKDLDAQSWRQAGRKVLAGDVVVKVCATKREAYRAVFQHNASLAKK